MSKLLNAALILCMAIIATLGSNIPEAVSEYQYGSVFYASSTKEFINTPFSYSGAIFVGDVMLARKVEVLMNNSSSSYPFSRLSPVASSTLLIGNFESSVPKHHTPTPFFNFVFSTSRNHLSALKEFGFTHVSLANNHTFDFNELGYINTVTTLEESGIETFGHPLLVDKTSISYANVDNHVIALLAINKISTSTVLKDLDEQLKIAHDNSDMLVVYVHWGPEYVSTHSDQQEAFATYLSERDVDVIIGHHPHVVQDIQIVNNTLVFYSLGNFIFDQYFSTPVQEGLTLHMSIYNGASKFELIPVTSLDMQSAPRLMNESERAVYFSALARSSDDILTPSINSGVIFHAF